jgi:hypothetical protein
MAGDIVRKRSRSWARRFFPQAGRKVGSVGEDGSCRRGGAQGTSISGPMIRVPRSRHQARRRSRGPPRPARQSRRRGRGCRPPPWPGWRDVSRREVAPARRSHRRGRRRCRRPPVLAPVGEMLPELNAVAFRVEEADELALSLGVWSDRHRRRLHAVLLHASDDCVDVVDAVVDDVTLTGGRPDRPA